MARRGLAAAAAVEFNTSISSGLPEESYEYVITLYLGTPAQKFFLTVDTGSDLLWVQCVPCIQCFNETNTFFDPSKSSTYSTVACDSSSCNSTLLRNLALCSSLHTCEIHYTYVQQGSELEGTLSTETISFSNSSSTTSIPNIRFGCMNNNTASFGQVDGIVGFARGVLSLPNQLSTLNSAVNVFSYCLVPFVVSATLTSSLEFGVPDTNNNLQLVYTPILNNDPTFYWVSMTGISINGMDVKIPTTSLKFNSTSQSGGTLFDSGTTVIMLMEDIWTVIAEHLKDLIKYPTTPFSNSTICYNTSGVQQVAYPNMTLHFSGLDSATVVDFELTPQNLFLSANEDVDCLAMASTIGANVIGNVAQADHYVETDLENMRIGWKSRNYSLPL